MRLQILDDAEIRPSLFVWNGPIEEGCIKRWLKLHKVTFSEEIVTFLTKTGGGDLFESETLLGPLGNAELGDDLDSINCFYWETGLPKELVIFHTGLGDLTAFDTIKKDYVQISEIDHIETQRFSSFDQWYQKTQEVSMLSAMV